MVAKLATRLGFEERGGLSRCGSPQGGVISPLPANLYLNRFLKDWRPEGKGSEFRASIANYADDFVILSGGGAAEAPECSGRTMRRIGLTLKREKTKWVQAGQEARLMAYRAVEHHVCERVRGNSCGGGGTCRRAAPGSAAARWCLASEAWHPLRRIHLGPAPATA